MPITEYKELTKEEKAEFKKKGEEYQKLRYDTHSQIDGLKEQIGNLEKQLKKSVPKTPSGEFVCRRCHVRSMRYLGRTPQGGMSGGDEIYECEICGSDDIEIPIW